MLKILKGFVYLMAVVGFLTIGFLVWQGIQRFKETAILPGLQPVASNQPVAETSPVAGTSPAQTPAPTPDVKPPADPALAAIVQSYQKQAAAETAATGEAAAAQGATASSASSAAARPVRTPGPTDKIIRGWPTGRKWVALTYDDGPHPEHTPRLMELLKSKNVDATFFVVGPMVEKNPDILRALVENGFEIGNHTMNHPEFRRATQEKIREELEGVNRILQEVAGVRPRVMRPPYGQAPRNVQEVADQLDLKIVTWNIDTEDWKRASAEAMKANIMKNLADGVIVLMHDTRGEKVYEATEQIIDEIRAKGYEFVTVSEMLGLVPYTPPGAAPAAAPAAVAPAAPAAPAASTPVSAVPAFQEAPADASSSIVPVSQDLIDLPSPEAAALPPMERKMPEVSPDKQTVPAAGSR